MYGLAASDQVNQGERLKGKGERKTKEFCTRHIRFQNGIPIDFRAESWSDFRGTDSVVVRRAKGKSGMIGKRGSDIKKIRSEFRERRYE
jgi:hypothetical protein